MSEGESMTVDSAVTPEEFARYAETHLGPFQCEVCGTRDWNLEVDPTIGVGPCYMQTRTSDDGFQAKVLVVVDVCIVSCKYCGNIKTFLRDRVERWIKENPRG